MRKALHLLGILDDVDLEWIASNGRLQGAAAGTTLIHEGQPIEFLYVVLEGQLSVVVGGPSGRPVAVLYPGEIVGEISFVQPRPPSASVIAVQNSQLLVLQRELLNSKLGKDVAFAARFYKAIAVFLADRLYITVGRLGYGSAWQDAEAEEIADDTMDLIDVANMRVDKLLKRLRSSDPGRMMPWSA